MIVYLNEASKQDAKLLAKKGRAIQSVRTGQRILFNTKAAPGERFIKERDPDLKDKYEDYYNKNYKIDINKFNNSKQKELTRKEAVKNSARSKYGSVPDQGANPRYSKDIDPKAKKKYEDSYKYAGIDIDKTVENMPENKSKIVRQALERGHKVPKSLEDKLIKKKKIKLDNSRKYSNTYYNASVPDDDEVKKVIQNTVNTIGTTKDLGEYKRNYKKMEKMTGLKNTDHMTLDPNITWSDLYGGSDSHIQFHYDKRKKESIDKDAELNHTSSANNIKSLYPTITAQDKVAFSSPRIYAYKDKKGTRTGYGDPDKKNEYVYKIANNPKIVNVDTELRGGSARYINSKVPIKVKKAK